MIVLAGIHTYKAQGVFKEVATANNNKTSIIQIIVDDKYTRVPGAGKIYKWTWGNLKNLLS